MANIKFSQFTVETDIANFDDVVGYQGLVNKRITPANLASSLVTLSGGPYLPLTGGTLAGPGALTVEGAATFNNTADFNNTVNLTNTVTDSTSSAGNPDQILSCNGSSTGVVYLDNYANSQIGYKSSQVFQWLNGTPVAYANFPFGAGAYMPFNPTPLVDANNLPVTVTASDYNWTCANAASGSPAGQEATFTLGANGGGIWKITTAQHWFDQNQFIEVNCSIDINGTLIEVVDERSNDGAGNKLYNGQLIREIASESTVKVFIQFQNGTGVAPFPSDSGNRPIEISFEKIV